MGYRSWSSLIGLETYVLGALLLSLTVTSTAQTVPHLSPENLLILVNDQSPTSHYLARLYRQYHPDISDDQILLLPGLSDASGPHASPATEIITRQDYESLIAQPVRDYLTHPDYPLRFPRTYVIVTTAGMPYRIADTAVADALYPAGSNAAAVGTQEASIDAASVESELTCLWYSNNGLASFGLPNRMVNPYQGCRSSVACFERAWPHSKPMSWAMGVSTSAPLVQHPLMEGDWPQPYPPLYTVGTSDRSFGPGDIYLTCRLDGPKAQGHSAVFTVRAMLERARRASDPLRGVPPELAVALLDDAPTTPDDVDNNRVFNLNTDIESWQYLPGTIAPPDSPNARYVDDYTHTFLQLTGQTAAPQTLNAATCLLAGGNLMVVCDRRPHVRTSQNDLDAAAALFNARPPNQAIIALATFGVNGDTPTPPDYLFDNDGTGQLNLLNGAVFTSLESFNAVTMFSDVATQPANQAKIVDFISIGGTAAIGHAFEPQPDAAADNEFLFYNLLVDADLDARADLTFVEAAFSSLPYLSWAELVIGDPLMRLAYGPGEPAAWQPVTGDANGDGRVDIKDRRALMVAYGGVLDHTCPDYYQKYNDLCDLNRDGYVNSKDFRVWMAALYAY